MDKMTKAQTAEARRLHEEKMYAETLALRAARVAAGKPALEYDGTAARDAVLYGGTPAPEYQTRPDAYEQEE